MMDGRRELVTLPVADQDIAKAFYIDVAGFGLIVDHRAGERLHVVVRGSEAARAELVGRQPEAVG